MTSQHDEVRRILLGKLTYTVSITDNLIDYESVHTLVFMHWPHLTTWDFKVCPYRMYSVTYPIVKLSVF